MPTSSPSPDEVVQALAQTALLALVLAGIVLVTRAMQISFDKKQAERARLEAAESARQRLKTLSDRNLIYRMAAASSPALTSSTFHCRGPLDETAAASGSGISGSCLRSASSSFDSESIDFLLCGGSSATATPSVASGGGAASLIAAATSCLLQRRQAAAIPPSPRPDIPGSGRAYGNYERSYSHGLGLGLAGQHHSQGAGSSGAGGSLALLLRKNSDSLLETSRVLGSVPLETVTSTRQVLAAFNYDYSALHRRESSYVSGTPAWQARNRS